MRLRGRVKQIVFKNLPGFSGSFPYFKTKVYFPQNSYLFHLACQQGVYEAKNIQLLRKLVRPGTFYFDVGANIGLMAIPILYNCSSCKVVSFEPSPNTIAYLEKTISQSTYGERWCAIAKAVSETIGSTEFCIASSELGAFDGLRDTRRAGKTQTVLVPVTTIDAEWLQLGRPAVSVIKIDIEGAELFALKGALECIQQEKPSLLIEWSNHNLPAYQVSFDSLLIFAKDIGYQVFNAHTLLPVTNPGILRLQMMETESFLLMPGK